MRRLSPLALILLAACSQQATPNAQTASTADTVLPDEVQPSANTPPPSDGRVRPDFSHRGEAAPALAFTDPAGKPVTLAKFKGKPLLVNLWATWCGPCIAELPTIDAIAVREAGKLQVIAVNQDSEDAPAKVAAFFAKAGFKALQPYRDEQLGLSVAYRANLPTTILYGADGKERWRVTGGMDWTGPAAAKLLAMAG